MGLMPSDIKYFAPPLNAWKQYRYQTGAWPFLSVMTYLLQFPVVLSGLAALAWYSSKHDWSTNKLVLVALVPAFGFFWFWHWLQRAIRVMEFHRFRARSFRSP
jgi:hypothetical protein